MASGRVVAAVLAALIAGIFVGAAFSSSQPLAEVVRWAQHSLLPLIGATGPASTTRTATVTTTVTVTVPGSGAAAATTTATVTETATVTRTVTVTSTRTMTAYVTAAAPPGSISSGETSQAAPYYAPPGPPARDTVGTWRSIGPVRVGVGGGILVVEYRGRPASLVLGLERDGDIMASLTPPGVGAPSGSYIDAVYFTAGPMGFTGYYRLDEIASRLGAGSYRLVIYGPGGKAWVCSLRLKADTASIHGCSEATYTPAPGPRDGYPDIYTALVMAANTSTSKRVAEAVLGQAAAASVAQRAWRLLAWAEENMAYDYAKQRLVSSGAPVGVKPPLATLRDRSGVCSDYAVLLATAAAGAGLDAYIVVFPRAQHAAAAVGLGAALYVLDQRLPPVELQDYLQYIDRVDDRVAVIHVEPGPRGAVVTGYWLSRGNVPDLYPADRLPQNFTAALVDHVAEATGLEPNNALAGLLALGQGAYYNLTLPRLAGIEAGGDNPLGVAYSPVFADRWAGWLAGYAERLLARYYGAALKARGSFWADALDAQGGTLVRVYAVPLRGFHVTAEAAGDSLVLRVAPVRERVGEVSIGIYPEGGSRLCGAVAPPGYRYSGVPYVEAREWRLEGNTLVVTVSLDGLRRLAMGCGPGVWLGVWLRGSLVYGYPLG